jgi:hypothetical protein
MESTYTGRKAIRRDGHDYSAEVTIRVRPDRGGTGVGFSSEAQRYINATFGADFASRSNYIWHAIVDVVKANGRHAKIRGIGAYTFRPEVVRIQVSANASPEDSAHLLAEASRIAAERYFAALEEGVVQLTAEDVGRPFEFQESSDFDEEFISRRRCFQEYVSDHRAGFLFGFASSRAGSIEKSREERTLTVRGTSIFNHAVCGYLYGCRPEADALVAQAYECLTLADACGEKSACDYSGGWGLGQRYAALAYLHWLKTGEDHETARAQARKHFLPYYQRSKTFDRRVANLSAPELLFLEADSVLSVMADRLSRSRGKSAARPGGIFGDALRISQAESLAEREGLKAKLRKRIPLQFFRWMSHGNYHDVAFILRAVFPRPEGPPSRLIESAWNYLPEIERIPGDGAWDVKRK